MRNTALRILIVVALFTSALTLTSANPTDRIDASGHADPPEAPPTNYTCVAPSEGTDPLNVIDRTCAGNDSCGGAEAWPVRTTATSSGNVGGTGDTADWSKVLVYRTETLVVHATVEQGDGLAIETGFDCAMALGTSISAGASGWHEVKLSSIPQTPYSVTYTILANDARSGDDADDTGTHPWFISAIPYDVTRPITYAGSLPNRENPPLGPEQDQDWYRIGTNLAAASDPTNTQGPAVGLLRITVNIDCGPGTYTFNLYTAEGIFPIEDQFQGCGFHERTCITSGVFPVTARFAVRSGSGTGYDFTADILPLYLVNLNDGVPRTYLDPGKPFCDLATPAVLEAAGWAPGTDVGFVDSDGLIVAKAHVD